MKQVYVVKGIAGRPLAAFLRRSNAEEVTGALETACSIEALPVLDALGDQVMARLDELGDGRDGR